MTNVTKYTVKRSIEIGNHLFLKDDVIYISSSFRYSGKSIDWHKVFSVDRTYIADIASDSYCTLTKNETIVD